MNTNAPNPLPPLRQNLRLMPGTADEDGSPRWLMFDVVNNRYFTIARATLDIVQHWQAGMEREHFVRMLEEKGVQVGPEEVSAFVDFLIANHLVEARDAKAAERMSQSHQASQLVWWKWALHNYLYFRVPLFRPDAWLARWTPRLNWLFSPATHYMILGCGLVGGLMVLRDWDRFQSTFLHFFSLEGLIWYGAALLAVKSAHELGHAFVAHRHGCRVASMGVAFLVMFPVLYTDTTDAWRLRSRSSRLRIVTAGVRTELYIAMVATFLWNVLPDGPFRSATFFLATTSWLASLLVNISPFMRFDGYYALSDALGVENLQQRAFALGRWKMRQLMFGLSDPVPEALPRNRTRLLIAYAWATWIYRVVLFMGIALLVYHFFFKVLGIFLFAVEILWFVVLPIWRELREWYRRQGSFHIDARRKLIWGLAGVGLVWMLLPLQTAVQVPAVVQAAQVQTLFLPEDAYVESIAVRDGDPVKQHQLLASFRSPALELSLLEVGAELGVARLHLSRVASSVQDKAMIDITENQIRRMEQRQAGLRDRLARLKLVAPFDGAVRDLETLHAGRWVNASMPLVTVVNSSGSKLRGLLSADSLDAVRPGQTGLFIPDRAGGTRLPVTVSGIDIGAVVEMPYPELASTYGGHVAVRTGPNRNLIPEGAQFNVSFAVDPSVLDGAALREAGVIVVNGTQRSWMWTQFQRVVAILIRESGF